jgi:ATP-dependent protease ClpP protease subunit
MNRFLGFMNALVFALMLLMLIVSGGGVEQKQMIMGTVVSFIPMTLTMFAVEARARFLRTAIVANAMILVLFAIGVRQQPYFDPRSSVVLVPFVVNIIGLTIIWLRLRRARLDAQYAPVAEDAEAPPSYPGLEPLPKERFEPPERYEPDDPATNYFVRHWRGQLSLAVSFWVNCLGATLVCVGLIALANKYLEDISLRGQSTAVLSIKALLLVVTVWSAVGTWSSAGHHAARGGARGWAVIAQILVVLEVFGTATNFFVYQVPQMREHWLIATGRDPIGQIEVQLSRDGQALVLTGELGAGSASKVKAQLEQTPDVATIVLESPGGRMTEAVGIARLIRERKLNTYVETHCESACTLIFLAGEDRAGTPDAQIGFHRASFPGMDPKLDAAMTEKMIKKYREAGLSEAFLERIRHTRADDMWYPARDELFEAHVINRISAGGETAQARKYDSQQYLAFEYAGDPIVSAINDRFPGAANAAAAAAWGPHQRGASDAVMWAAARKVILGYYARLLRNADDSSLRTYLQIRLDQLRAARQVSVEACALLATSSLDITKTLPRELYERELLWLRQAIKAPDRPRSAAVDPQEYTELIERLAARFSPEAAAVMKNPAAHAGKPELLCQSTLQFYEAVRALPLGERNIAVRGLFQASGEGK